MGAAAPPTCRSRAEGHDAARRRFSAQDSLYKTKTDRWADDATSALRFKEQQYAEAVRARMPPMMKRVRRVTTRCAARGRSTG